MPARPGRYGWVGRTHVIREACHDITLHDKSLEVRLTPTAQKALAKRATPLVAEMGLLFSCLLRKRVHFGESLENPRPYVPNWLAINYRRGEWVGEFGYAD